MPILYRCHNPCQTCHSRAPSPSIFSLVRANISRIESSCAASLVGRAPGTVCAPLYKFPTVTSALTAAAALLTTVHFLAAQGDTGRGGTNLD